MSGYGNTEFDSREQYLRSLAEEHEVDLDTVLTLAELLGPDEDFDGLVSALQDYTDGV